MSHHVVVIGAGITGLTAAHHLTSAGHMVTVVEESGRIGGLLHTRELHGQRIDVGAEAMHVGSPAVSSLLSDVGLDATVVTARRGTSWLWTERGRRPLPAGVTPAGPTRLRPVLESGVMTPLGLVRAGLEPLLRRTPLAAGDDISVGAFVASRFGREVAERLVDPLLGSLHAGDINALGLRSCAPSLVPAAESGRSLLRRRRPSPGTPTAPGRPTAGGSPTTPGHSSPGTPTAPGRLTPGPPTAPGRPTVGGSPTEPAARRGPAMMSFISWADGLSAVSDALAQDLDVRLNSPVAGMDRSGTRWIVHLAGASSMECDAVVLAVPVSVAQQLLASHVDAALFAGHTTASVATLVAAFPAEAAQAAAGMVGANGILVPSGHGSTLKAATFLSNKWDHFRDSEHALVRMSVGRSGGERLFEQSDDALATTAVADLARFTGLRADPVWMHVERWPHAMPQLTVGHTARMAALRAALPSGVALAGASYDGVGITSCLASAARAAQVVGGH